MAASARTAGLAMMAVTCPWHAGIAVALLSVIMFDDASKHLLSKPADAMRWPHEAESIKWQRQRANAGWLAALHAASASMRACSSHFDLAIDSPWHAASDDLGSSREPAGRVYNRGAIARRQSRP